LIILFGCNSNNPTKTKKSIDLYNFTFYVKKTPDILAYNDNTVWIAVDTTLKTSAENDYNLLVNKKLTSLMKQYKEKNSRFNIDLFTHCNCWFLHPYIMDIENYTDEQKFIKLYNSYLIWNSDSTKAIDLYSNNLILDFDEKGIITKDTDVDPHFALMDFKNNKRIVLWQMGAISTFKGGFWLNENKVIILVSEANFEAEDEEDTSFTLSYYLVNLKTYQIDEFCSK